MKNFALLFIFLLSLITFMESCLSDNDHGENIKEILLLSPDYPGLIYTENPKIKFPSKWQNDLFAGQVREFYAKGINNFDHLTFETGDFSVRFFAYENTPLQYMAKLRVNQKKNTRLIVNLNGEEINSFDIQKGWYRYQGKLDQEKLFPGENRLEFSLLSLQEDKGEKISVPIDCSIVRFLKPNAADLDDDGLAQGKIKRNLQTRTADFERTGSIIFHIPPSENEMTFNGVFSLINSSTSTPSKAASEPVNISIFVSSQHHGKTLLTAYTFDDTTQREHTVILPLPQHSEMKALEIALSTPSGIIPDGTTIRLSNLSLYTGTHVEQSAREETTSPLTFPETIAIVLLDAARADHFGCYGYPEPTTPNVDRFSREQLLFTHFYANAPFTISSVTTLLTGCSPQVHRVIKRTSRLNEKAETLQEKLSRLGFQSSLFSTSHFLSETFGLSQGFNHYENLLELKSELMKQYPDAPAQWRFPADSEAYIPFIHKHLVRVRGQWQFLYAHFMQPHQPYCARINLATRYAKPIASVDGQTDTLVALDQGLRTLTGDDESAYIKALYDNSLYIADRAAGRLMMKLKKENRWEKSLFVILSDHGEAFGEHKRWLHNSTVFNEMVHIPFIIKKPGRTNAPRRFQQNPLSILHFSQALFDFASGDIAPLKNQFFGEKTAGKIGEPIISISTGMQSYSLIDGQTKYISHKIFGESLFNLEDDPAEKINLAKDNPIITGYYREILSQWIQRENVRHKTVFKFLQYDEELDNDLKNNLEALGYLE